MRTDPLRKASEDAYRKFLREASKDIAAPAEAAGWVDEPDNEDYPDVLRKGEQISGDLCRGDDGKFESCGSGDQSLSDEMDDKFNALAEDQRGLPESAMHDIAHSQISAVYASLAEHVGDLTHRMAQKPNFFEGGYEWVGEKLDKTIRWLGYGGWKGRADVVGQVQRNSEYYEEQGKSKGSPAKMLADLKALGEKYASEHAKLKVYNTVQRTARDAAVDIGKFRFEAAHKKLSELKAIADKGYAAWRAEAMKVEWPEGMGALGKDGGCGAGESGSPGFQPGNTCGGKQGVSTAVAADVLRNADSDPEVRAARRRAATDMPTASKFQKPDGSYVPEREEVHLNIVRGMLNPNARVPEGQKPRMVMLLGIPASGKSKVLRPGISGEFTTIDADAVKAKLPEYDGKNAGALHKESGHVAEDILLSAALLDRHNILLDWTGKNTEKTLHRVKAFVKLGYDVEVHHVTIPPAEAASRALGRFKTDGRFVDPEYIIKDVGRRPDETYKALKNSGLLKKWRSFDNDVPKGSPPILLDEGSRED